MQPFFHSSRDVRSEKITVYLHVATGFENTDTQAIVRDADSVGAPQINCSPDVRSASAFGAISGDNNGALTTVGDFHGTQCTLFQSRQYFVGIGSLNLIIPGVGPANAISCGGYR